FYSLKEEDKVVVIGQSTAKKLLNFKNLYICANQSLLDCVKLAKTLV
ncbi:uroporphyrinogen-III synthase, partial [Campylobacter jejuni]|nr:uroporphyrinogen-III synthase [Campylobacter jejuni]